MVKKGIFLLVLVVLITGGVFAQTGVHEAFDMFIGLNLGLGISPNIFSLFNLSDNVVRKGNYAITADFGVTYDFYLFPWLSFNSGVLLHPDLYSTLDVDLFNVDKFTDIMATPLCVTIPVMAHVNIPMVEWLYVGAGVSINIPVLGMMDSVFDDSKGDAFFGVPMDVGFDFIKPGKGGGRFFFRVTPEIHKNGTTLPIGFIWQIYNWRIFGKQ